jgi:hypothetical protein
MSNDLGLLLTSCNILFFLGLHVEIKTSHNYHNINIIVIKVFIGFWRIEPVTSQDLTQALYQYTITLFLNLMCGELYLSLIKDLVRDKKGRGLMPSTHIICNVM